VCFGRPGATGRPVPRAARAPATEPVPRAAPAPATEPVPRAAPAPATEPVPRADSTKRVFRRIIVGRCSPRVVCLPRWR
jgi:hypothetical protein